MKRTSRVLLALGIAAGLVAGAEPAKTAAIPDRPEQLHYPPLRFEVPDAAAYRHVLSNGVPVYVVEDHALPLVNVAAIV
ncbi:MAG: insulinase family protein, partial [Deltaproteobacteria bacterium]